MLLVSELLESPYITLELDCNQSTNNRASVVTRRSSETLVSWLAEAIRNDGMPPMSPSSSSVKFVVINYELAKLRIDQKPPEPLFDLLNVLKVPTFVWTLYREVGLYIPPPPWDMSSSIPARKSSTTRCMYHYGSGIAWSHNAESTTTVGIMWINHYNPHTGLKPMDDILQDLINLRHARVDPLSPALSFLRSLTITYRLRLNQLKNNVWQAQIDSNFNTLRDFKIGSTTDIVDFSELSITVSGIQLNLVVCEQCCRGLYNLAERMLEQTELGDFDHTTSITDRAGSDVDIAKQAGFWKQELQTLILDIEMWQRRGAIITSSLSNIREQQDQKIAIALATDSKMLAEQGRILAEESKKDSTSMEAIAAVTMCFLPGTFIASFFSMSFFEMDFQTESLVGHQMWLYWVVTLPLTFVTVACWILWKTLSAKRWQRMRVATDKAERLSGRDPSFLLSLVKSHP